METLEYFFVHKNWFCQHQSIGRFTRWIFLNEIFELRITVSQIQKQILYKNLAAKKIDLFETWEIDKNVLIASYSFSIILVCTKGTFKKYK